MAANRRAGFSLIELLCVLSLLAVLALVAWPAYQYSLEKGRRTIAAALLMEVWAQQEAYRIRKGVYAMDLPTLDLELRRFVGPHGLQAERERAYYRLHLRIEGEQYLGFELEPLAGQENDPCGGLQIDLYGTVSALGERTAAATPCL